MESHQTSLNIWVKIENRTIASHHPGGRIPGYFTLTQHDLGEFLETSENFTGSYLRISLYIFLRPVPHRFQLFAERLHLLHLPSFKEYFLKSEHAVFSFGSGGTRGPAKMQYERPVGNFRLPGRSGDLRCFLSVFFLASDNKRGKLSSSDLIGPRHSCS